MSAQNSEDLEHFLEYLNMLWGCFEKDLIHFLIENSGMS